MRIALCFSGQPRFINLTKYNILENLINYYNADVFYHAWTSTIKDGSPNVTKEWIEEHCSVFKAKLHEIEDYNFDLHCPDVMKEKMLDKTENWYGFRGPSTICQYYSILRCNELKKKYEKENNFVYDVVFRVRFDVEYPKPVVTLEELTKIDLNNVWMHNEDSSNRVNPGIFFANSKIMDCISQLHTKFTEYFIAGHIVFDECILDIHLITQGIQRSKKDCKYYIRRC
jgi:hypothetical protein